MSTAKNYFSGNGRVPPEKSTFATTCNRLSQFLKEKGNLRDLGINANFDVTGKPETSSPVPETNTRTVDFLSNLESSVQTFAKTEESMNHLPYYVSLDSFCKSDDYTNKGGSSLPVAVPATESSSKIAQMTIFYRGQVLVFDSVSNDKARDVMLAASACASSNNSKNRIQMASTSNSWCEDIGLQEQILPGLQSDLPIARRASLHKFLAKRKDRASVLAPYQLHNPLTAAASNHKFDLNLKLS